MPIFSRMRARLYTVFAAYLTRPLKRGRLATPKELPSLSPVLRNGDVLLTEGNTRAASLVKRLTRSTWSHVSMYVGPLEEGPDPLCIVEADLAAGVRAIRISELEMMNVRVLRPVRLGDADRGRLAAWVVSRIGGEYDLGHAWRLARSFLPVAPKASLAPAPAATAEDATRFICSTLLGCAFAVVGSPIPPIGTPSAVSAPDYRYVIPSDFETASGFEVVV